MELSGEMVVTPAAVDAIAAPQKILAIVELELVVETGDDYFGETIADGFQYALKLEFGRCCPELSRSYDLHTQIRERRTGSKICTLNSTPPTCLYTSERAGAGRSECAPYASELMKSRRNQRRGSNMRGKRFAAIFWPGPTVFSTPARPRQS